MTQQTGSFGNTPPDMVGCSKGTQVLLWMPAHLVFMETIAATIKQERSWWLSISTCYSRKPKVSFFQFICIAFSDCSVKAVCVYFTLFNFSLGFVRWPGEVWTCPGSHCFSWGFPEWCQTIRWHVFTNSWCGASMPLAFLLMTTSFFFEMSYPQIFCIYSYSVI